MLWISVLALLTLGVGYLRTSPPGETLYRCVEDGDDSAVYVRRLRQVAYWGNCGPVHFPLEWTVEEFMRITCAPGVAYTDATSDWFKRTWCDRRKDYVCSFVAMERSEGHRRWRRQIHVTRKVAQGLRGLKGPNASFVAT